MCSTELRVFSICLYRKNGCSAVSRMNGVMLPGNTSAFTERFGTNLVIDPWINRNPRYYFCLFFYSFLHVFPRKVNGPGTPRPLNRPKLSLANSLSANGLPDSTDNEDDKDSRYLRTYTSSNLITLFHICDPLYRNLSEVATANFKINVDLCKKIVFRGPGVLFDFK